MGVQLYVDHLSQPSRAVALFLKANGIPHEVKTVSLTKGEQKKEEYLKNVNPLGKVPALNDSGFKLTESIAILRYLARKFNVDDHWYPKDLEAQARVDEFLEWYHLGLREPIAAYFLPKFVLPLLAGQPVQEEAVKAGKVRMEACLDLMENVWLKDHDYVAGDQITIADLMGLCEIDEQRITGYEPTTGRPKLEAWMNRVTKHLGSTYDEVAAVLNSFIKNAAGKS